MSDELLPCPFCGGQPVFIDRFDWKDEPKADVVWLLSCNQCHNAGTNYYVNKEDAIKQWNTRSDLHARAFDVLRELVGLNDEQLPTDISGEDYLIAAHDLEHRQNVVWDRARSIIQEVGE